jgi:dTDP-4-amino-4,6-dideoxygalactose transaminase
VPLFRPAIREEAVAAASQTLRSGWIGMGPRAAELESAFAAYVEAAHCVGVSSGTAAIQLALRALRLPAGAEVVTTPITFVSANEAILEEGLTPVFADVDATTGSLDPASVAERVGPRTGAILVMHYAGYPADVDAFEALAARTGVALVADCAHACGAAYRGRPIGGGNGLHAFSFDPVKNLPTMGAGAVTTDSPELAERLRRLRSAGVTVDTFERVRRSGYEWDYEVPERGLRAHLNDVAAAVALAQLPFVDEDNRRRAELVARYRAGLGGVPGIELLRHDDPERRSSNHLFCVLAERRDELLRKLREAGVDAGVHYRRNDDFALFERAELPAAESFSRRALSLPLFVGLRDEQVDAIVETVRSGW